MACKQHQQQKFQDIITTRQCPPLVFKGLTDGWPARKWTPLYLSRVISDQQVQCKICNKCMDEMLWETECLHLMITLGQYTDWLEGRPADSNPLRQFDPHKFSCYIDYKYMKDFFKNSPDMLHGVRWDVCGLQGRDGTDSTIWIGSAGSYTPCHQDTYGFNLVAQLQGRKRWILFGPDQTHCMYPTRVPYEESSIFSEVNIRCPDLAHHPLFKGTRPYVVDLVAGDILYVPRHWWHFVESLEPSISINTWVPMEEDVLSHYHEAITRLIFTSLHASQQSGTMSVNTNEELQPTDVNLDYLKTVAISAEKYIKKTDSGDYDQNISKPDTVKSCSFKEFCGIFNEITVESFDSYQGNDQFSMSKETEHALQCTANDLQMAKRARLSHCLNEARKSHVQIKSDVHIFSVTQLQFDDYINFLIKEYRVDLVHSNLLEHSEEAVSLNSNKVQSKAEGFEDEIKRDCSDNSNTNTHEKQTDIKVFDVSDKGNCDSRTRDSESFQLVDVVNSVLDPDVVQLIGNVLMAKLKK